jgi:outer membrane biosynthesis protein TonB
MRARGMSPAGMPAAGPCSSSSNCSPRHTETPRPGPNHIPIPAPNPPGATARQVQRDRVRPGYRTDARAHGQEGASTSVPPSARPSPPTGTATAAGVRRPRACEGRRSSSTTTPWGRFHSVHPTPVDTAH